MYKFLVLPVVLFPIVACAPTTETINLTPDPSIDNEFVQDDTCDQLFFKLDRANRQRTHYRDLGDEYAYDALEWEDEFKSVEQEINQKDCFSSNT